MRKTGAWEETTSFALTTTTETASQVADRLYLQTHFDASCDKMLVINIETGVGVSYGPVKYPATLGSKLVRHIQK